MLVWLALGGLALLGVLALLRGFARASVAAVRSGLIAAAATLAVLLAAVLLVSGRAPQALATLTLLAPLLWTGWQGWRTARRFSRSAAGRCGRRRRRRRRVAHSRSPISQASSVSRPRCGTPAAPSGSSRGGWNTGISKNPASQKPRPGRVIGTSPG